MRNRPPAAWATPGLARIGVYVHHDAAYALKRLQRPLGAFALRTPARGMGKTRTPDGTFEYFFTVCKFSKNVEERGEVKNVLRRVCQTHHARELVSLVYGVDPAVISRSPDSLDKHYGLLMGQQRRRSSFLRQVIRGPHARPRDPSGFRGMSRPRGYHDLPETG